MGIRDGLRTNRARTAVGVSAVLGLFLIVIGWELIGGAAPAKQYGADKAFYTDDDGATTFVDDAMKMSPFDHNGKKAVRVHMFRCGGRQFIGYLERYSDESLARIKELRSKPNFEFRMLAGIREDVKKPLEGTWVSPISADGAKILDVQCPDGKKGNLETVMP